MKQNIYALIIVFLMMVDLTAKEKDSVLIVGRQQVIASTILHEERSIWIHLPENYGDSSEVGKHYPVIYVLDGEFNFLSTVGVEASFHRGGRNQLPEAIIVGIENTDRTRDLTPTAAISKKGQATMDNSGGGEAFVSFLEKELLPTMDEQFRTNKRRILIGHSFGGLTAIHVFLKHTHLFSDYLAIDPSFWWDDSRLLKEAKGLLDDLSVEGTGLFIASAGMEKNVNPTYQDALSFPQLLKERKLPKMRWHYKRFEEEDHGSVVLPAIYYGMRFLYDH